jgi:ribonuclease T1
MAAALLPRLACAALAALVLGSFAPVTAARETPVPTSIVALAELPKEARDTYERIRAGGPFRYERDGVVFGNREKLLPAKPRGYYHEYTVTTPGATNRGARRIVCGGPKREPDACYYSDDHYQSFRRIRE